MQPGLGELLAEMNEEIAARRRFLDRATSGSEPPYADMDASIVALVRAINQLPGLYTSGSCGGHEEPLTPVSAPADEWWIGIELASVKRDKDLVEIPTDEAWLSLEFLTYVTGHLRKNGVNVQSCERKSALAEHPRANARFRPRGPAMTNRHMNRTTSPIG